MRSKIRLLVLALLFSGSVEAGCDCACMNGVSQAICTVPGELRPICASQICPIQPSAIRPIEPLLIPPLGTRGCHQEQVFDAYQHRYVWKTICR